MIRKTAVLVGLVSALALPASASADTAVIGSPLTNVFSGGVSNAPTVTVQVAFQAGTSPNPVTSPADGVITTWSVKSGADGATYALRVLRPTGPVNATDPVNNTFFGAGSSATTAPVPVTVTPTGDIFTQPANIAIKKGDYIGLSQGGIQLPGGTDGIAQFQANGRTGDVFANNFANAPADGASANLLNDPQHELLLQATVKFCKVPDLKNVKKADAPGLLTKADCAVGKSTVKKLKKTKKNRKKKNKVIKQSLAAGVTAAPGTAVDIKTAKLKK